MSFPVWEMLCEALSHSAGEVELRTLVNQYPGLLTVAIDADGAESVGITSDAMRSLIRKTYGVSAEKQKHIARHFSSGATLPLSASYGFQAVPLHAALGGTLEELLADGESLAGVGRYALLQGIEAAWPDGVPQDGLAGDMHYLEEQRVDPVSHGEWISWLHWAALNRGLQEVADGLVRAGSRMPWRTVWSRWRPYGVFGSIEGELGRVDQVRVQRRGPEPVAVMRRVVQHDNMGGPLDELYVERAFRLDDGTEVGTVSTVRIPHDQDTATPLEFDEDTALPAPRTPNIDWPIKAAGPGRWLIGGEGGLFAVEVPQSAWESGTWADGPFLGAMTAAAPWLCPEEALAQDAPSQAWLEKQFGNGSCRTIRDTALPDGLRDEAARSFLSTVGMPFLPDQIPFFTSVDLDEQGLAEFEWPEHAPEPGAEGPFYRLGTWTGGAVVLDGSSGSVLQDTESGYSTVLLASSLAQFFTVLRLYHEYRMSWFVTKAEASDARWSLREWAEEIDVGTADGDHWDQVFDGDLDNLGSY
ncbi:SUKH-4 family immunity protein [Streptomyces sp. 8N706]|uniref:SUKH-4 family immunity protein n=1 Tax=Streptomyces sp. 8N706 TaxID=3457416 RepID=UPI003FD46105